MGTRPPFGPGHFGAVLLDGPCSGTGVLRHHPDGRWRLKNGVPARKGATLARLAGQAADLLVPGGLLMYATCSLEPEENEEVVERLAGRASGPGTGAGRSRAAGSGSGCPANCRGRFFRRPVEEDCRRRDEPVKLWKFLLLLASLVVTGGVLLLLVNFLVLPSLVHSNKVVTMPDIRGMTVDRAPKPSCEACSLEVEVTRQRAHPSIPEGMILDQIPAPESRVRGGRTVRVVTSSGPPAGSLPTLAGLSLRQAEITLQRENFRLGRVLKIRRPGVTEPVVAYQNPVAGTDLYKGAVVNLVVAEPAAAELLRMPDLRGMPLFKARQAISDAGFILAPVTYERTSRSAPNLVLSQHPPAGRADPQRRAP